MLAAGAAASLGLLAWVVLPHLQQLLGVAGTIEWPPAWAALACAAVSYAAMGLALWEILGLLGYGLPFLEVLGITFVSSTANYLVSSAGISGFALKAHLLAKRQVPYGATVTASAVSTGLMYFVLAVFIGEGMAYLFLRHQGARLQILEGAVGLMAVAAAAVPLLTFFFNRDLRGRLTRLVFRWVNHAFFYFSKREIPREDFAEFERQLEDGLELIHRHRGRLTRAIGYTCLDWVFAMLVLYFSLRAFGWDLNVGSLSAGFAVGQAATLIPLLPGGLGAVEGSMAAVLQSLGVPWDDGLAAVLWYRLAYYALPSAFSVFLLWGLQVSEPALIRDTALETRPEELRFEAAHKERHRRHA